MTDPGVDDLHYGHFGQPTYDVDNKAWVFPRTPGVRRAFRPLGDHHVEVPASAPSASFLTSNATELDHQQNHLLSLNPELRSASRLLCRAAQLSNTATAVAESYDPLRGELLAFGRAADVDNKGSKGAVRIAAHPAGAAGASLRLVQLQFEHHGWYKDKSIWLKVPTLSHGDVGWWPGNGAPILQVCCANQSDGRGTFVAARTTRSIDIFQPIFHRLPVPPPKNSKSWCSSPPSRLEASHLVSLASCPDEPGYADITFNTWYQRQFATLDQEGNWTVYDIEGRRGKRFNYRTIKYNSGRLDVPLTSADAQEGTLPGHYDGWGRILWVKDVSTMLVCNRRLVQFVDFQGRSVHLRPSSLRLARSPSWILDVKGDPKDSSRIVLVTSTHVLLLKTPLLVHGNEKGKGVDADVLLSWRHWINDDDTTLQISLFVDGEETVVLLRSLQISDVITFRYRKHEETNMLVSVSDPTRLPLDKSGLHGLHAESLDFGEEPLTTGYGPGSEYRDRGLRFFNFHFLSDTLEASRRLAFTSDNADGGAQQHSGALAVEYPSWIKRITAQSSTRVFDGSFIVPDDLDEPEEEPKRIQWRRRRTTAPKRGPWTVDSNMIDRILEQEENENGVRDDSSEIITELASKLASTMIPDDYDRHDTLFHLAGRGFHLDVSDIDETACSFQELIKSTVKLDGEAASLAIKPLECSLLPDFVQLEDGVPSVLLMYDWIIHRWVSTLPAEIPARVRLGQERLARRIAMAICLSSFTVNLQQPEPQQEPAEAENLESEAMDVDEIGLASPLAFIGKGKGPAHRNSQGLMSSQLRHSQISSFALPTPEATPSLSSEATLASSLWGGNDSSRQRLSRLGVTFHKRLKGIPSDMKDVVAQWKVGSDPAAENDDEDGIPARLKRRASWKNEKLSPEKREKLLRQAEKKARKQRRETELYLSQQSTTQTPRLTVVSQPPVSFTPNVPIQWPASSPGLAGQPSQLAQSSQAFASTQVERGAHGGRPKKKRRRTEGF